MDAVTAITTKRSLPRRGPSLLFNVLSSENNDTKQAVEHIITSRSSTMHSSNKAGSWAAESLNTPNTRIPPTRFSSWDPNSLMQPVILPDVELIEAVIPQDKDLPPTVDELQLEVDRLLANPVEILDELLADLFIQPSRLLKLKELGEGAYANVSLDMLATKTADVPTEVKRVAVKRLKPEVIQGMDDLSLYFKEINLMRKLVNPRIASIFGIGASNLSSVDSIRSSVYFVMEAMEGGDLKMQVVKKMTAGKNVYSQSEALSWMIDVASAMQYLHETCQPMVIHRDLKLENVLISSERDARGFRVAKVSDLGLHKRARLDAKGSLTENKLKAGDGVMSYYGGKQLGKQKPKLADSPSEIQKDKKNRSSDNKEGSSEEGSVRRRTAALLALQVGKSSSGIKCSQTPPLLGSHNGAVFTDATQGCGSYLYMAPELIKGHKYNEKIDVFAFAILAFEIFSGRMLALKAELMAGGKPAVEAYIERRVSMKERERVTQHLA